MNNNFVLECRDLTKSYRNGIKALDTVNLSVKSGGITGLLGPNGSGKTTLIKLIAGLLTPTSGEIKISGFNPGIESKKLVSYLPERDFLQTWLRVCDLIDYYADFYNDFDKNKAYDMLARLKLDKKMKLKNMSKGTREKVQLILVMSRNAALYLLDEPIGGVDPATRDYILNTIISNYSEKAAVIISTHLIADIERVLDGIIFLNQSQITMVTTVDEIREKHHTSVDALFREVYKC